MVSPTYIEHFDTIFCTISCRWQYRQRKLVNLFTYLATLLPTEVAGMILAERSLILKGKSDNHPWVSSTSEL